MNDKSLNFQMYPQISGSVDQIEIETGQFVSMEHIPEDFDNQLINN